MNQIIKTSLSDKVKKDTGITPSRISSELLSKAFPSILIESEEQITVNNGQLCVGPICILLSDKTIIEIVKFLRDNGISSFLTTPGVAGYPASLLLDFNSHVVININPESSPLRLSNIHSAYSSNLVVFSEDNIDRDILGVWNNNVPSTGYERVSDLVFFDNPNNVSCLVEYKINKYFLMCGKENTFTLSSVIDNHFSQENVTPEISDLLIKINSDNKDIL